MLGLRLKRKTPCLPEPTVVFMHIPKTGGISLQRWLWRHLNGQSRHRINQPIEDVKPLKRWPRERLNRLRLVEGHMYYGLHRLLNRPCAYITVLRDPLERVLSLYSFMKEWEPHHLRREILSRSLTLADCLRVGLSVEYDNFMVRSLTSIANIDLGYGAVTRGMLDEAKAHLDSFAAIGLTDRLDESARLIEHVFSWQPVPLTRENVTGARLRLDASDDQVRALVQEHNALDFELYRYANERFAKDLRTVGGP
jgi:hypothetical protein